MQKEIKSGLKALQEGGIIIYPTDTIWGIGCDATNYDAVEKVYELKKRPESKSLIILVDGLPMLKDYIRDIPANLMDFIIKNSKPTSVIYKNPNGLAGNLIARDNTVAIRIVKNPFCQELIREFGKPIVSTSANISGTAPPSIYNEINESLLKKADYVVNLSRSERQNSASQLIKINDLGEIEFLRK